jgi:regulator of sigma E protease
VIDRVATDSIADKIGLKKGDEIVEAGGKAIQYNDELRYAIEHRTSDSLSIKVKRGGEIVSFKPSFKGHKALGVALNSFPEESEKAITYTLGQSILLGPSRAFGVITAQVKAFGKIFKGEISPKNSLSGPVRMAKMYGGEWNWAHFWRMTGLISLVLAFMNLLPIPGLDGGYVAFLIYEMITGKEPNEKIFENAIKVGMAILLALMIFVFYNDIVNG